MKKENYILVIGVILCGFVSSPDTLEPSFIIRHIVFGITALLLCSCILLKQRKNISSTNTTMFLFYSAYCLITTLSICKAYNKSESLYFILTTWMYFIFLFCAATIADKKIIIKALVFMGLFLACKGLYDILQADWGKLRHTFGLGFANGRNQWASSLLLLMPFSMYAYFKNKSKIAALTAILLLINIICLQTRAVYVGLFAALLVTLWQFNRKTVLVLLMVTIVCALSFSRLRHTTGLHYRLQTWERTVKTFCNDPMLGVGAGNWKIAATQYGNKYDVGGKTRQMYLQRAHNDFLEVFTEIGFLGGGLYLAIFGLALYYSSQGRDKTLGWTMRFGIISYMAVAFFSFPKERALHTIILLTMIGLLIKDYPIKKVWSEHRSYGVLAFCSIILLSGLFVNTMRHRTEVFCKEFLIAKAQKDWQFIVDIIEDKYTPFSTMVSFAVTPILQYKGEAHFYLNEHDKAMAAFAAAYKQHPYHPSILVNLGYYNFQIKNYKESYKFYLMAKQVLPDHDFMPPVLKQYIQK